MVDRQLDIDNSYLLSYNQLVKYLDWNAAKNELIKIERGISFEEVINSLIDVGPLDILEHPNQTKYSQQKIMIVNINDYIYLVPFVEDETKIFLKTVIPSRKATKHYLIDPKKHESKIL